MIPSARRHVTCEVRRDAGQTFDGRALQERSASFLARKESQGAEKSTGQMKGLVARTQRNSHDLIALLQQRTFMFIQQLEPDPLFPFAPVLLRRSLPRLRCDHLILSEFQSKHRSPPSIDRLVLELFGVGHGPGRGGVRTAGQDSEDGHFEFGDGRGRWGYGDGRAEDG